MALTPQSGPVRPPRRPPAPKPPRGGKGGKGPKGGKGGKGGGKKLTIGFNPQKMAKTLTDLEYGASIAEMQRQIEMSNAQEAEALKDLQAWAAQIEDQRATGAAASATAWEQAKRENLQNDANINQLFGGPEGEAGAYAGVGQDMMSALSASDASYDARMGPVFAAQARDYERRAMGQFDQQQREMLGQLGDLRGEKGKARAKNLLDLMDMAWGRKQDILQYQTAQQALQASNAMMGLDIQGKKLDIQGQALANAGAAQNLSHSEKANALALKVANAELRSKLAELSANPNGIDWNNPTVRESIGASALKGAISERNTFAINPRAALRNAMLALQNMGLANDPRAKQAVLTAFRQILNISHARKQWVKYKMNKNGELIHAPAGKGPAVVTPKYGRN